MRMKVAQAPLFICLLIISIIVNSTFSNSFAQTAISTGPNVDSVRFTQYSDENIALKAIKSGDIGVYLYRIPLEVVSDVRKDLSLAVYDRDAGSFGILLNPAPPKDNATLNPFQIKQVRSAVNYLIDREFVVNDILK